eukprot:gene15832-21956_t
MAEDDAHRNRMSGMSNEQQSGEQGPSHHLSGNLLTEIEELRNQAAAENARQRNDRARPACLCFLLQTAHRKTLVLDLDEMPSDNANPSQITRVPDLDYLDSSGTRAKDFLRPFCNNSQASADVTPVRPRLCADSQSSDSPLQESSRRSSQSHTMDGLMHGKLPHSPNMADGLSKPYQRLKHATSDLHRLSVPLASRLKLPSSPDNLVKSWSQHNYMAHGYRQSFPMNDTPAQKTSRHDDLEMFTPSSAPIPYCYISTGLHTGWCNSGGLDALENAPMGIPRVTSALDALLALPDSVASPLFTAEVMSATGDPVAHMARRSSASPPALPQGVHLCRHSSPWMLAPDTAPAAVPSSDTLSAFEQQQHSSAGWLSHALKTSPLQERSRRSSHLHTTEGLLQCKISHSPNMADGRSKPRPRLMHATSDLTGQATSSLRLSVPLASRLKQPSSLDNLVKSLSQHNYMDHRDRKSFPMNDTPAQKTSRHDDLERCAPSSAPTACSFFSTGLHTGWCNSGGLDALENAPMGIPRVTSALDALLALPDSVATPLFTAEMMSAKDDLVAHMARRSSASPSAPHEDVHPYTYSYPWMLASDTAPASALSSDMQTAIEHQQHSSAGGQSPVLSTSDLEWDSGTHL